MDYVDELILGQLRRKNERALSELYKAHYPMVARMVIENNGTEDEAKDIYQETVIAFYERIQDSKFVLTCRIPTYLYAVAWRLWLKRLSARKKFSLKVHETEEFLQVAHEMASIEDDAKRIELMNESLRELGEPCGSIITDFYIHALTMEQIRSKFGYTNTDNAKNQKYKCLQRLKKIFFDHYKEKL
ncbi:MAG TPA: sigma-70 family RNA polymerase sigma factor [Chryseosolibacter sp.]|nr:sigma-70 family RNA polymerase sigma factor [Chryseosolibacter sp.]